MGVALLALHCQNHGEYLKQQSIPSVDLVRRAALAVSRHDHSECSMHDSVQGGEGGEPGLAALALSRPQAARQSSEPESSLSPFEEFHGR